MREALKIHKTGKLHGNLLSLTGGGGIRNFHNKDASGRGFTWTENAANLSKLPLSPTTTPTIPSIALIIFLSFSIAEIFEKVGVFQDNHGIKAKEKADQFKEDYYFFGSDEDLDDKVERIWNSLGIWWRKNRQRNGFLRLSTWRKKFQFMIDLYGMQGFFATLQYLSFKHQFAIGCSVGMIFQRITLSVGNVAFFIYVASEMMYNLKKAGEEIYETEEFHNTIDAKSMNRRHTHRQWDLDNNVCSDAIDICCDCLEKVRYTVRRSFDTILDLLNEDDNPLDDGIGTAIVGVFFGVILKSVW